MALKHFRWSRRHRLNLEYTDFFKQTILVESEIVISKSEKSAYQQHVATLCNINALWQTRAYMR